MTEPHDNPLPPGAAARLAALDAELREIVHRLEDPAVLADHRAVRDLSIRKGQLEPVAAAYRRCLALQRESAELHAAMAGPEKDFAALAADELPRVREQLARVAEELLAGLVAADDEPVASLMMEFRAGTGGAEATLWTRDLIDMYQKHAARRGWAFELIEMSAEPEVGGVRAAVASVRGDGAWRELNFEAGVHSVKRVPATETQGRIHTSTATIAVLPEPSEVAVKIDWQNDVEEFATTSQGPGGQNVNKVATAVQVKHKPTGIIIRMQESKSQQQNRERARRLLLARLYELERQKQHAARSAERSAQIGGGERSEKIRTYRWKEGIVADERLPGEYPLRDVIAGNLDALFADLIRTDTARRVAAL